MTTIHDLKNEITDMIIGPKNKILTAKLKNGDTVVVHGKQTVKRVVELLDGHK